MYFGMENCKFTKCINEKRFEFFGKKQVKVNFKFKKAATHLIKLGQG